MDRHDPRAAQPRAQTIVREDVRAMMKTRHPVVAGTFYPSDPAELRARIEALLSAVEETGPVPKAMIVPHAGLDYSGVVAARAWARVRDGRGVITRVVLVGPSHYVPLAGVATPSVDSFATPLGDVPIDREAIARIERLPQVHRLDVAHRREYAVEVELPFLQVALATEDGAPVRIVPLAVGVAAPAEVAAVLEVLWGGPETLVVVSSDLSNRLPDEAAKALDASTTHAIETLDPDCVGDEQACGRIAIRGLLAAAARHRMRVQTLDVRTSADTAGTRDEVVGYGAWTFRERAAA